MHRGKSKRSTGRDPGPFVALLPMSVLDSKAYTQLSYPAKALLPELARQYTGDDNGRLLLSRKKLALRGWTSPVVIQRARDQLIAAGFVHETVKGRRPNKASWYAVTWQSLDKIAGYDPGVALTFRKSAYRDPLLAHIVSSPREQHKSSISSRNEQRGAAAGSPCEPIRPEEEPSSCSHREHPLEKPSAGVPVGVPFGELASVASGEVSSNSFSTALLERPQRRGIKAPAP